MHKVECPSCAQMIRFESQPKLGQLFTCSACSAALVVSSTAPLSLNWVALNEWAGDGPSDYDRRHKPKKHKKRYAQQADADEDAEEDGDDFEAHGKRHRPKRSRSLDEDYDY